MHPDALRQFNEAAEKARAAIKRAMEALDEAMRQVEAEKARRLAAKDAEAA